MDENNRAADFTETTTKSACNEDEESRAMIIRRRHFYQCCFSNLATDEPLQLEIGCCLKRISIYPYEKVSQAAVEESSHNLVVMADGVASRKKEGSVVQLFESPQVVRFLKFLLVTMIYIIITHSVIRWMNLEHDPDYTLHDFLLYDFNLVCLDALAYFIVGRLFARSGVDSLLPFLLVMGLGCFSPSIMNTFRFLQHSVSAYEIACRWPWQLFIYVVVVIVASSAIIWLHLAVFYRQGILLSRLIELSLCIAAFILPFAGNASFHLHHWYASWVLGMHANAKKWWSISTLAFLWGSYVNGVAVYGRDPLLTCAYSFYLSANINCDYMSCYTQTPPQSNNDTVVYKPYIAPDWRNCSANHYHL